jgi:hypothetical protein
MVLVGMVCHWHPYIFQEKLLTKYKYLYLQLHVLIKANDLSNFRVLKE